MRIGYLSRIPYRHDSPSGGLMHVRQFLTQAAEMGQELYLIHGGHHPHLNVHSVPPRKLSRLKTFRAMDVLYYRVEYRLPRDAQWMMPPRSWLLRKPVTVWEFNSVPEYARVVGETEQAVADHVARLRKYGAYCDLAVCVSHAIEDYVRGKLGIRNVMTIPNGTDPDLFTPGAPPLARIERHPNRLNVVWIGSAELKWHNFELLSEAARLLWDNGNPVADFHIIGPGMQDLRDLPPNVHYHGPEQYDRLPNWLTAMDVGLNVYKSGAADYSSPLKLFDYMASGLTLVSTDQPQAREIFGQLGQLDLLVPTDDPRKLADVLRGLARDRERLKRQGAASRKLAVDFYSWKRAVCDTIGAIEAIAASRGNTSKAVAAENSMKSPTTIGASTHT